MKKIINTDEDISACSNNAAFVITVATEMFLQHLVEQAYNIVKSERKPRRNIQYRDVANAVARVENLEFLTDVVPKTVTYKTFKQKQAKEAANGESNGVGKGQGTLDGHMGKGEEGQATNGASREAMEVEDDDESENEDREGGARVEDVGEETTRSPEPAPGKPAEDLEMEEES